MHQTARAESHLITLPSFTLSFFFLSPTSLLPFPLTVSASHHMPTRFLSKHQKGWGRKEEKENERREREGESFVHDLITDKHSLTSLTFGSDHRNLFPDSFFILIPLYSFLSLRFLPVSLLIIVSTQMRDGKNEKKVSFPFEREKEETKREREEICSSRFVNQLPS